MHKISKLIPIITLLILTSQIKAEQATVAIIDSLLEASFRCFNYVDLEGAKCNASKALNYAKVVDYNSGKARAYFYLAQGCFHSGEYKEALEKLMLSQECAKGKNKEMLLSEISRVRGQIFASVGLYNAAINEFRIGLRQISKIKDKNNRDYLTSLAYENLSIVYTSMEEYDLANDIYMKSKKLLESMDEPFVFRNLINLYTSLGWYKFHNMQFEEATQELDKAIMLLEKYNYPYSSRTLLYKGKISEELGDFDNAIIYFNRSLENLQKTKLIAEIPNVHTNLSRLYNKLGDTVMAKSHEYLAVEMTNQVSLNKVNSFEVAVQSLLKYQTKNTDYSFVWKYLSAASLLLIVLLIGYIFKFKRNAESKTLQIKKLF